MPKEKDTRPYLIIDRHTGATVGTATGLSRARRKVDKKDNEYGAYRYTTRPANVNDIIDD